MWLIRRLASSTHTRRCILATSGAVVVLLLAEVTTQQLARSANSPSFGDYRVSKIYRGPVMPPLFGSLEQYHGTDRRCFDGDLVEYTKEAVNFAGHYVIDACSCGTGCHYLYMWDALTGKVFLKFPSMPIDIGPFGLGVLASPVEYRGEEYRLDSSLLIVEGCIEETCDCSRRYYKWSGSEFKLIERERTRVPPRCASKR